jgi:DNA-binding GntR family transcriptional regulator
MPMGRMPAVAPLKRRRLVDEATHALRAAILSGRLAPGVRLRQTDLADRLGISRTPIREALGRLQQEAIVQLLPGGGVRVAVLDLHEAAELYDLREVLDGLAARLAAGRATPAAGARLERALDRMRQCLERGDANQWFGAHVAFHDEIFRASGNARLQSLSAVVRLSIQRFHPLLLRTAGRLQDAYGEHRAIADAIAGRDAPRAEQLARAHIAAAKAVVLAAMTEEGRADGAVQA